MHVLEVKAGAVYWFPWAESITCTLGKIRDLWNCLTCCYISVYITDVFFLPCHACIDKDSSRRRNNCKILTDHTGKIESPEIEGYKARRRPYIEGHNAVQMLNGLSMIKYVVFPTAIVKRWRGDEWDMMRAEPRIPATWGLHIGMRSLMMFTEQHVEISTNDSNLPKTASATLHEISGCLNISAYHEASFRI